MGSVGYSADTFVGLIGNGGGVFFGGGAQLQRHAERGRIEFLAQQEQQGVAVRVDERVALAADGRRQPVAHALHHLPIVVRVVLNC